MTAIDVASYVLVAAGCMFSVVGIIYMMRYKRSSEARNLALALQEAHAFEERQRRRVGNDGLTDVERDAYLLAWQNKYAARPSTDAEFNQRGNTP